MDTELRRFIEEVDAEGVIDEPKGVGDGRAVTGTVQSVDLIGD